MGIAYLNRVRPAAPARRKSFAIEPLEERILPSGIHPGAIVKKASFVDADGDKVKIKMKGDLFTISLLGGVTNNADVDTINILPGKKLGIFDPNAVLKIKVKHGKTGDGITEIANIRIEDDGSPLTTEHFGTMQLNDVVLHNLEIPGNLTTLSATNSDFGNVEIGGALGSMIIGQHDLTGTISAHSIGTITNTGPLTAGDIAGNVISETTITKILTNRVTGSISAGGAISTFATVEDLDGSVEANGGTLTATIGRNLDGSITVHNGNLSMGTLTTAGVKGDVTGTATVDGVLITGLLPTLSINAAGDFAPGASISASGNLTAKADQILTDLISTQGDVTFAMKSGGLTTAITAGDDVFGDGANGAIVIRGGNLSGQIRAGGNIAAITLNPATLGITGSVIAGGDVGRLQDGQLGDLTAHFFNGATVAAGDQTGTGSIGNIVVRHNGSAGGIPSAVVNSNFTAATNIGSITVEQTDGEHAIDQSSFEATTGALGAITATTSGTGSAIRGLAPLPTFKAGTTVGAITASALSSAAIETAEFQAGFNFDTINATSTSGDGFLSSSFVSSGGSMGAISGTSSSAKGINDASFQAAQNIASITGTSATDEGINESTFRTISGAIGNVIGRSTDAASTADAISDSDFTAGSTVSTILGTAQLGTGIAGATFSAGDSIFSINASTLNADTAVNKDGIQNSVFRSGGSIGNITASTAVDDEGLEGATESEAIDGSIFSAFGDILASSGDSIEASGDIQYSIFLAGYDIGGNLQLDGLAGAGSDDRKGNPDTPVRIGDIAVGSDIVGSFFAAGVGTDNNIIGDGVVGALDDFLNAMGSSIGTITVGGVITGASVDSNGAILGTGGFNRQPLAAFSSDIIGLIEADAIGMSDVGNATVSSVGISTTFFLSGGGLGVTGTIEGITASTSTRAQAVGDGSSFTVVDSLGFLTVTNLSDSAVSAIGTGFHGSPFLIAGFIGDITATAPNSATAVAIDGRGILSGDGLGVDFVFDVNSSTTDLAIGHILATAMNVPGAVAIENAFFGSPFSGHNIATITTVGDIVDSQFGFAAGVILTGNVANVAGRTGIHVQGNIIDSIFLASGALAGDGGITVLPIAGEQGYISGSTFEAGSNDAATSLAVGNIFVGGKDSDGAAITGSGFTADSPGAHIGSIQLTAGSLERSQFSAGANIALEGGIFVFGNTVHKDFGIHMTDIRAGVAEGGGDLGGIIVGPSDLPKNTVGTEVSVSNFSGTNVALTDDMDTEDPADDVGGIIIHGNNTGSATNRAPAETGLSIFNSTVTARDPENNPGIGSIGDVLIAQSAGDNSGGGIENSDFVANDSLGSVKVKINVTDADEDVSAISNSLFRAQSFDALAELEYGKIGDVVAIITGLPSTQDVIVDSDFDAGRDGVALTADSPESFGNITATTGGTGAAVNASTFRSGGSMGSVTANSGSPANNAVLDSIFSAFASIGSGFDNDIGVVGNVLRSMFLAGLDIETDLNFSGFLMNPGDELVQINRVSINGNLIESDIIAGIDPGAGNVFGDSLPIEFDDAGDPLPPAPQNDTVAAPDSRIGTVQVQGGTFLQSKLDKSHAIEAGFIDEFQQPHGISQTHKLPGFLDNGPDDLDVRVVGAPSGVPIFLTSRDFAGQEVDFNFDGITDVIMIDSQSESLKVLLGDGQGGFGDPLAFRVGTNPVAAVIGNFGNGLGGPPDTRLDDGVFRPVLDIVVLNSEVNEEGANTIDIFFGDSVTGSFSLANHETIPLDGVAGKELSSIVSSDWINRADPASPQGDQFLDLLITNETDGTVLLFAGNGTGGFSANAFTDFEVGDGATGGSATPPTIRPLGYPTPLPLGAPEYNIDANTDLRGTGGGGRFPDAVVANNGANSISVLFGNDGNTGNGQFEEAVEIAVGTAPIQTFLGDVDNDNDVDIFVVNFGSDDVTILFNDGSGDFTSATTIAVGMQPRSIILGHFNNDSFLDFATANFESADVSIVLNTDGIFTGATVQTVAIDPLSITSGDYDNDGDIDLAVSTADNAQAPIVLDNDGTGIFTLST